MKPRVTIEDIAAEAGVSRQTVTRAMNGMPRISEETRARVLEVSERLGYRPSRFASNLARTSRSKTVGFVVDSFRNPYYSELTADLLDAATARGWQVSIASHENQPALPLVSRLAGEVDAIVGYIHEADEAELAAAARGVPLVLLGRQVDTVGLHSVNIDFRTSFRELVAELDRRGSKRFGMLESRSTGQAYVPSSRRVAYEASVDAVSREAVIICEADAQSVDAGELGFGRLMDRFPDTDTVIAFSDLMAMGALREAHRRNIAVPEQVKILGIDGLSLGAITSPALSSLAIVGEDLTAQIVDVIAAVLQGDDRGERREAVPVMHWRESA